MDDKQQNFYKRLLINIRVKCLTQGIKKSEFCLKQGRKISDICLKQGQGMRGRAAPPHPEIYRVPPPPPWAYTLPCTSPVMVRVHGPSLSYLFRKPEQSKTNQFYGQQCWILQQSQTSLSQHLLSFLALSFDFLHFIHGSTIGFSVKNELLITVKKKVNFFTNRSVDRFHVTSSLSKIQN